MRVKKMAENRYWIQSTAVDKMNEQDRDLLRSLRFQTEAEAGVAVSILTGVKPEQQSVVINQLHVDQKRYNRTHSATLQDSLHVRYWGPGLVYDCDTCHTSFIIKPIAEPNGSIVNCPNCASPVKANKMLGLFYSED